MEERQLWEYRVIFESYPTRYPNDHIPHIRAYEPFSSLIESLEELGLNGWELCGCIPCPDQAGTALLVFKRPATEEALAPIRERSAELDRMDLAV